MFPCDKTVNPNETKGLDVSGCPPPRGDPLLISVFGFCSDSPIIPQSFFSLSELSHTSVTDCLLCPGFLLIMPHTLHTKIHTLDTHAPCACTTCIFVILNKVRCIVVGSKAFVSVIRVVALCKWLMVYSFIYAAIVVAIVTPFLCVCVVLLNGI